MRTASRKRRAPARSVRRSSEIMPPKPSHLALRERVLRMRSQAGVVHARDLRLLLEPVRQRERAARSAAPCAAPASSRRAARGSCRTGPAIAPTAFCRKPSRSRSASWRGSLPTTATPPITSEWPFRYLVVECTTMSKPSSSGRCTHGLAKVLSATRDDAARAADLGDRAQVGQPQQRVGRRLDPDQLACRAAAPPRRPRGSVRSTKLKRWPALRLRTALEQAEGAAVDVVARDDVRAGVEQLEHGRDRGQAGGEREGLRAAFEVGDAALERPARRVVRAAVVEALVHARALLHVGRGRVDRRHDRAGRSGRATGRRGSRGWRSRASSAVVAWVCAHVKRSPQVVQQVEARDQAVEARRVGDDRDQAAVEHGLELGQAGARAAASAGASVIALATGRGSAPASACTLSSRSDSSITPTSLPPSSTGSCDTSASRMRWKAVSSVSSGADADDAAVLEAARDQVAQVAVARAARSRPWSIIHWSL